MRKKLGALFMAVLLVCSFFTGCSANAEGGQGMSAAESKTEEKINEAYDPGSLTDGRLKVHYIDVGQGDSVFIVLPNGKTMLIDAGEREEGLQTKAFLQDYGVTKIDAVVATHPHSDHIGGLEEIIRTFDIGAVYMPKASNNTKTFENLLLSIKEKGLNVTTAKAGVQIALDDTVSIQMVGPVSESYEDLNNYSAVIRLQYKNNSFLFTGDAEGLPEEEILKSGAIVSANVLKVGHHGSNTSTTEAFLKAVSPQYAVIQVGEGNSYGHPKEETLDKLEKYNAAVLRNDLFGTITFASDGDTMTVDCRKNADKMRITIGGVVLPAAKGADTAPAAPARAEDTVVYITSSGKKYHLDGCKSLSKSKIETTLGEVKGKYEPCGICKPPQ